MSVYPSAIDDDSTIPRADDDLTENGALVLNALREAVFALESELGIDLRGALQTLADRLNVSLDASGEIKASALTSVGLVTLPITDSQVGSNAGIKEYKLTLDHSTADLYTSIQANTSTLNSLATFASTINSDLRTHIAGGEVLTDGDPARHVASQIDLNAVPSDDRDVNYSWSGLIDKDGYTRTAETVADGLLQINDDLTAHENATSGAHVASAITVNTEEFLEIPETATTVQAVIEYLDQAEVLNMGEHRATQHSNSIPKIARSVGFGLPDGYGVNVVPPTAAISYLIHSPYTSPVDDLSIGDDLIKFVPDDSNFVFDSQFSQVKSGDILRILYSTGLEASYEVDSVRFIPGSEWIVRIAGVNLEDDGYAFARIDRAVADIDTAGVLAVAAANATPSASFSGILTGFIIGHPKAASAVGIGFNPGQLDDEHYSLYLEMYPTGNPNDHIISLPAIDVTGNAGATPGKYDLESVIQETNNSLRKIGFNYRFIAFSYLGCFGIMMAEAIGGAAFAIISGQNSSGTLTTGSFTNNVIGGNDVDDFDALGLGANAANLASPAFQTDFSDTTSAMLPTKVILPRKKRNAIVNGQRLNKFAPTYLATTDDDDFYYWDGYVSARTTVGTFTVKTTYTVSQYLCAAGLAPGKTITVQPAVDFSDASYHDVDYGRFIIDSVNFAGACGDTPALTQITVINSLHGFGSGFGFSSSPNLAVKLYFGYDSVGVNHQEIIDTSPATQQYHRLHEIYIDSLGKTFSHERARLPRQAENVTTGALGTDRWHIRAVSPKFRGYRDADPLVFNKFIRLYILDYDTTTGEFDGYLGKRVSASSTGILATGDIVHGRKNVPVRFYDETNVDFIDLEFVDGASPGTAILSTAVARFVDIEIFPSLALDDELMLLATAEVNWNPASGQDTIERVIDYRAFGSISEKDFTPTAIDFISAGDRELHTNGVLRGYDYDSVNTSDNRELYFKGGSALVNGKIVNSNNQAVNIPQVYPYGTSLPQTVTWAVCVNESGYLVPIILTGTKEQFFATSTGSNSYYLPSVTFQELIQTRKDLLPLYVIEAEIASFTLGEVNDVRLYVKNEGGFTPLSLSAEELTGHFQDFTALKFWMKNYGANRNIVWLRGTFDVTGAEGDLDLSDFENLVILEGDGAILNVTARQGLILGSHLHLKNLTFNYNPSGAFYNTGDLVNVGAGCLYSALVDLEDVRIEGCTFNYTGSSTQHFPFINIGLDKGNIFSKGRIIGNTFDGLVDDARAFQAAIAIYATNNGSSSDPAVVKDVLIKENFAGKHGIYLTAEDGTRPGLACFNVIVSENFAGTIGFMTSSVDPGSSDNKAPSLNISRNNVIFIGTLNSAGHTFNSRSEIINFGTGKVTISENSAHWIHCSAQDSLTNGEVGTECNILNNSLTANDANLLTKYIESGSSLIYSDIDVAIILHTNYQAAETGTYLISGNLTNFGRFDSVNYKYSPAGIWCCASATITNNIIRYFNSGTVAGILLDTGEGSDSGARFHLVSGNQIHKVDTNIDSYITVNPFDSTVDSGRIVNNVFDFNTANGTDNVLVSGHDPVMYEVSGNTNQTQTLTTSFVPGFITTATSFGASTSSLLYGSTFTDVLIRESGTIVYSGTNSTRQVRWVLPLNTFLPNGAKVTSVSISAKSDLVFDDTGSLTVSLAGNQSNLIDFTGSYVTNTVTTKTITFTSPDLPIVDDTSFSSTYPIIVEIRMKNSSGTGTISSISLAVIYQY